MLLSELWINNIANTRRMNRLEELGRVDAEKAWTKKGKRNLKDEKKRIVRELKATGGSVKKQGYKDREDESLGMRTGKESTKKQSMKDRRDESYGKWGSRPNQSINKKGGGIAKRGLGKAFRGGGLV